MRLASSIKQSASNDLSNSHNTIRNTSSGNFNTDIDGAKSTGSCTVIETISIFQIVKNPGPHKYSSTNVLIQEEI